MKFILLTILSTIIIFFVWNILKRMFFKSFYQWPKSESLKKDKKSTLDQKIQWDAQTVEYEEIKENENKGK
ncbi:hypothetical protein [Planobacterium oryzisoli]|uniref:Uncharacterized protein n=1 Tax=Planobacterium oryzisoli TaxID=2771435 RepID=A0A931E6G1_9FLAO|nr:hypothetical protein [Planobacterium oryzisoli]MBF5026601.1 hypothetical protein [Planobacterium oryzisoli]